MLLPVATRQTFPYEYTFFTDSNTSFWLSLIKEKEYQVLRREATKIHDHQNTFARIPFQRMVTEQIQLFPLSAIIFTLDVPLIINI